MLLGGVPVRCSWVLPSRGRGPPSVIGRGYPWMADAPPTSAILSARHLGTAQRSKVMSTTA